MENFYLHIKPYFWEKKEKNIIFQAKDIEKREIYAEIITDDETIYQLFYHLDISPYQWLTIKKYKPLFSDIKFYDLKIQIDKRDIEKTPIKKDLKIEKKIIFCQIVDSRKIKILVDGKVETKNIEFINNIRYDYLIFYDRENMIENLPKKDIEKINIYNFLKRFFPELSSWSFDEIYKYFYNEESQKDQTIMLKKLYYILNVENKLYHSAKKLRLTFEDLLYSKKNQLFKKIYISNYGKTIDISKKKDISPKLRKKLVKKYNSSGINSIERKLLSISEELFIEFLSTKIIE